MAKFGTRDDELCALTWPHNQPQFTRTMPPDMPVEQGKYVRYGLLLDACRATPAGTRIAYLDNDAVHYRRSIALAPNLGRACIGTVRSSDSPHNSGALYLVNGPEAVEVLEWVKEHASSESRNGHIDELVLAKAAEIYPERFVNLDPAWNNWPRAVGERKELVVVQAFHAMPAHVKLARVRAAIETSVRLEL